MYLSIAHLRPKAHVVYLLLHGLAGALVFVGWHGCVLYGVCDAKQRICVHVGSGGCAKSQLR